MKQQLIFAAKLFALAGGYLFTRSRTESTKYRSREKSAPDFAVMFILVNLKRFVVVNYTLIRDAKNQIEMLESDVSMFKAFLMDLSKRRCKNDALIEFENQISDLVYDGEDIIDSYSILTAEGRRRSLVEKCVGGPMKIVSLAKEMRVIRVRVKCAYERSRVVFATLNSGKALEDTKIKAEKIPPSICYKVESNMKNCGVTEESKELEVISGNDKPGYGKTWRKKALAVPVPDADLPLAIGYVYFKNPICVSRQSELLNLGSIMSSIYRLPDQDGKKSSKASCKGRKYMVVMDRVNPAC